MPESSFVLRNGRGERIRTFDLLNPIQVRYQAALRPDPWLAVYDSTRAGAMGPQQDLNSHISELTDI